jgi:hypothetical protein
MNKALLAHYREDPNFRQLLKEILSARPIIPTWKPQETRDGNEKLIEDIKFASAFQQGWDLLFVTLNGVKND